MSRHSASPLTARLGVNCRLLSGSAISRCIRRGRWVRLMLCLHLKACLSSSNGWTIAMARTMWNGTLILPSYLRKRSRSTPKRSKSRSLLSSRRTARSRLCRRKLPKCRLRLPLKKKKNRKAVPLPLLTSRSLRHEKYTLM